MCPLIRYKASRLRYGRREEPAKGGKDYGDGALASLWICVAVGARRASGRDSGRGEPPLRLVLRAPDERVDERARVDAGRGPAGDRERGDRLLRPARRSRKG